MAEGHAKNPSFGQPPPPGNRGYHVWADVMWKVQAHPGQWAKIATYTLTDRNARAKELRADIDQVRKWIKNRDPYGRWQVARRTIKPGYRLYRRKEVWVRYDGQMSEEEHRADLVRRMTLAAPLMVHKEVQSEDPSD
jgi:hypothetical protein